MSYPHFETATMGAKAARCRQWYHSLSPEDRARIYYAKRKET